MPGFEGRTIPISLPANSISDTGCHRPVRLDIRPRWTSVNFRARVADVDSASPRVMIASRARDLHVLRSLLVCVLSLWLTLSAAYALEPNKRLAQYAHAAWRIQDGFLPNTPYWVSQTKDGYLWVGGNSGALRFDGVRFTPWSAPIASAPILHPISVRAGEFWIATRNELAHVRDDVVISRHDVSVIAMRKGSDGSVWTLSNQNPDRVLCQVTDTSIRCFGQAEGITIHMPYSFLPDGKGGFWIGGDTSLLHWKMSAAPEMYSFQQLQSNVGQIGIHNLLEDSDGSLLVGIMAAGPGLGLERFRNGVLTPVVLPNFDGSKLLIHAMIEDSDKSLWIGTYGSGIYRIHGQTVEHFGRADGLSSDAVFDLYEGDDGIVWAATADGIDNFRDLPVTTFSTSKGLGPAGAASVMATKDGTVWVANLGTLDSVRNGIVSSVRVPGQQVSSLLEDHQGNIWVGVDDKLFIYKDGRFGRIPEPDHRPLGLVLGITEDVDGNVWAECKGAQERRLIRIRDFKVREEFSQPQVPKAKAIAADPKGGIWLGAVTGDLTFFRERVARTFPLKLKRGSWPYQIAVDPDGSVVTASDDGLVMLRAGKVQRLGKENGLPCDGVTGFAVDDNKNLWLNTPCGYVEIAASEAQRWRIHPDTIVQARVFGTLDGARPGRASFNPAAKSPDGRLWFVNNMLLQMIDPAHLPGEGSASPVYVEAVVADRKLYKPQEGLRLPPLTRDLQISYTSPSFLIPQKVKFRYRLDGHDRDWQDAGTRRETVYTQLGPGQYRFRVIACNNDGIWNEAGAALDFAIAPAYYQTNWFRLMCVAVFIALLWALHRWRVHRLKSQEKRLRDVVETIPAMTFTALSNGFCTFVNKRWTEYTGFSVEQTSEAGWQRAIHPDDLVRHSEKWGISVATGQVFEDEARFRRAIDGEYRWFLVRGVPLREQHGKIAKWYGTLTDIEDRKRAEQERERLRELEAELAHINRVSMMGEMAASLAHEIKQPITAAITSANSCMEWLAHEPPNLDRARAAASKIDKYGNRAAEIIDRIRSLYRKSPPHRELVDVNGIIQEILTLLDGEAARSSVTVRTELAADLPEIKADRVQLQQVFMNLMLNAIEAMKHSGGELTVKSQMQDSQVLFSVSDTGAGLPAEKVDQIFSAFFTTKPQGSGMGLAISRSIVESHGGRLWAIANDARGATFQFTLPTEISESTLVAV
jgi:PAS domain S-box-containing protein